MARSTESPCVCRPRTRVRSPAGRASSPALTPSVAAAHVPATPAPKPCCLKTRSTAMRRRPSVEREGVSSARARRDARSTSSPSPVRAETRSTGAPSRNEPATSSRTSMSARAWLSASATSHFVRTTRPRGIARSRQISKCSRVCGITDSSAATTRRTASRPWAPASMLRTKRSWPGTSTKEATRPPPRSRWAKPRSIVMPRSFSSFSRSGSVPVRARTSALLPWSTWPAVPTTSERASVFLRGHTEDGLRGLVQLGGEGEPRFLLRANDERVVLPRDLDEEEQLVPAEAQGDAAVLLVEGGLHQLVPQLQPGPLLVLGDEVVLLARHLLQEDQLLGAEVQ